MSIHVALNHRTQYDYDRLVNLGPQVVRLRPAPHCRTKVLSYSLRVLPEKHFVNWQQDPQSNYLARLVFPEPTRRFSVEIDVVAEMAVFNPFDFFLEPEGEKFPFEYERVLDHELDPFRRRAALTPQLRDYVETVRQEIVGLNAAALPKADRRRTIDVLVDLNGRISRDVKYVIRLEPGVQSPEETLELRSGSCRDSAWLLCQLLRNLGLAARFVSGYLIQLTPDVKSLDGPSGASSDFTDLHAWCEVYLPGAGWVGLDPTSGLMAGEGHLPLAATPDPQSAAPISGAVDECKCEFSFEMRVTRIHESPRVTKPYAEEQWEAIESLGRRVDEELHTADVRLTMGGEPTFVSIDDMDGAEWSTAAVGPTKALRADTLLRRLKLKFAPDGFLHFGQGKWYPGEPLPRWAYGCHWRRDGEPIWQHPELFAELGRDYGFTDKDSGEFIHALAERLGCGGKYILPGHEDAWYYLWKERRLPTNVDPFDSKLELEQDRVRLARIFEQGLAKVVGHVLPVQRGSGNGPAWVSGPWFLRPERMYLIPGDSPMGLRLPLDSLPWVAAGDYPYVNEPDPLAPRTPLPPRQAFSLGARASMLQAEGKANPLLATTRAPIVLPSRGVGKPQPGPAGTDAIRSPHPGESAAWLVRTAICVESRGGRLYIFMPPTESLEDYLDILAAVEDVAAWLKEPVVIEGYPPPNDWRLRTMRVTPDPGVIEVNLQPAHDWVELVHNTTTLYEEARLSRLGTEKFMLDGRHTGTGGGNHIIIGGATPADSPVLRRPDLLRSLLGCWHDHPSLSYLFSSLFLGPTSQHPRVDEARNDSLYELEIAFKQVPAGQATPPWLVDRLFRNLLIDVTGNTHRAEFCIDKLFSPDSSSGRLGLVELRGFEMPPHSRMSLAQHLLLRALIARFWKHPRQQNLTRWGTGLHDRFLLPHFVWDDFADVVADLQAHGYPLKLEWFAPHFEFRFPHIGTVAPRGIWLELRTALEPWHVLGEEPAGGATVRFVDASVERVQVKVRGLVDQRHFVLCNGRQIPLHPTGTVGEFVAGVRYRAWQPPTCLHPTIPVHAPLVLDVVDSWNSRSVGGCTYYVAHPGGLSYSTFPVNAYEAESRRLSRFFPNGHTPGAMTVPPAEDNREFPMTLDLRR